MRVHDDSVFHKPDVPKNTLQLFSWLIFEPTLLRRYSEKLTQKEFFLNYFRAMPWIVLISVQFYLLSCFAIFAIDAPLLYPSKFGTNFVNNYYLADGVCEKFLFILQSGFWELIIDIASGLAVALLLGRNFGLARALAFGLTFGLTGALIFGLAIGLANALTFWLTFGLTWGLVWGVTSGLSFELIVESPVKLVLVLIFGIVGVLVLGLISWLVSGLLSGLAGGLAFGLAWYFTFFRVYNYPWYWLHSLCRLNFYDSPYHRDERIWLPLWGTAGKFRRLALQSPADAAKFIAFLREYRPLQKKLADQIAHAAMAGTWLNQPLVFECLSAPTIENKKFQPSENWLNYLAQLKQQLIAYRQQIQPSLKQQQFELFQQQLAKFYQQTLVQNRRWRDEYLQALTLWQQVAEEESQKLAAQVQQLEPITRNVYLSGEALRPNGNEQVFLGRDDLKDELTRRICSAAQMPLFLIQGQRRVGKTSLLNFLEPLLGSGFKVVYQDLQSARIGTTVQSWLSDLQAQIHQKLGLPVAAEISAADWLAAWQQFETGLQALHLNGYKLILALDEYEALHTFLRADPEQGGRLLAAMRSFSQHQNQIVFLFVGAALFTELKRPYWAKYLVQAQTFRVDYLPHDAALRLITEPVSLIYPPDLPAQMVALTDGHPALLQLMCSEMVNIANRTPRKNMTQADLDAVVKKVVDDSATAPMAVFWQQFCAHAACKATVREIVQQQPISDKKQLHRLREHGFIVQNPVGQWRLRVPLFEQWLQRFDRVELD